MKMRLVDGFVTDLSEDPAASFHPTIAEQFIDVPEGAPDDLRVGYRFSDDRWEAPAEAAPEPEVVPAPRYRTRVSVARFKAMFGLAGQVRIQLARNYVPVDPANPDMKKAAAKATLDVLFGVLDDLLRTGVEEPVDLTDPDVIAGIDWIADASFISAEQASAIKRGVLV